MSVPKRIRLSRAKGWRKPEGAVVVSRPSRWGNPFRAAWVDCAAVPGAMCWAVRDRRGDTFRDHLNSKADALAGAVELFDLHIGPMGSHEYDTDTLAALRAHLSGHDLACWCPLDQPCHADVLLRIANGGLDK